MRILKAFFKGIIRRFVRGFAMKIKAFLTRELKTQLDKSLMAQGAMLAQCNLMRYEDYRYAMNNSNGGGGDTSPKNSKFAQS